MSRKRHLSTIAIVGVLAITLAGCASEDKKGPKAPPTSSATPTPTATATGTAAVRPPLTDLVLTTEGLGELQFGEAPPSDDPSANLVTYDATGCATETPATPGLWKTNYDDIDEGNGPRPPFSVGVTSGLLTRIDVSTTHIATDQGLSLGSSLDAVLGSYPGGPDEIVNHADVTDVYVFLGTNGKLMFEVAVDRIPGYWETDQLDTVVFLSAVSNDIDAYGVAATDNVVGVCNMS